MDAASRCTEADRPEAAIFVEPPRLRRPDRRQTLLEPVNLDERLPADHRARVVWAFVQRLDLSQFEAPLVNRGSTPGRSATDPACWWRCGSTRRSRTWAARGSWRGCARNTTPIAGCAGASR